MTPEERYDRIDATLDRAARMDQEMVIRQLGIRNMYRDGVNRMAELIERTEHQDALIDQLIDSQLRTEESLRRFEAATRLQREEGERRAEEGERRAEAVHKQLIDSQLRTEESLRRVESVVESLALSVKAFIESQEKSG